MRQSAIFFVIITVCLATAQAVRAITIDTQNATVEDWTGFGASFDPQFSGLSAIVGTPGKTSPAKTLKPVPPGGAVYTAPAFGTSPSEITGLTQSTLTNARAVRFLGNGAETVVHTNALKVVADPIVWGDFEREMAKYAQIEKSNGVVLQQTLNYAELVSDVEATSFTARGRVSAFNLALPSVQPKSVGIGSSQVLFKIDLAVYEDSAFTLDAALASVRDLEVWFKLIDLDTNQKILHYQAPNGDRQRLVEIAGTLDPGNYRVSANAVVQTKRNRTRTVVEGGFGEFDVDFNLSALPLGVGGGGGAGGTSFSALSVHAVPEPGALSLLVLGLIALHQRRSHSRARVIASARDDTSSLS